MEDIQAPKLFVGKHHATEMFHGHVRAHAFVFEQLEDLVEVKGAALKDYIQDHASLFDFFHGAVRPHDVWMDNFGVGSQLALEHSQLHGQIRALLDDLLDGHQKRPIRIAPESPSYS